MIHAWEIGPSVWFKKGFGDCLHGDHISCFSRISFTGKGKPISSTARTRMDSWRGHFRLSEQELVAVGPGPFKMPSLTCACCAKLRPQAVHDSSVMYAHPKFFEEDLLHQSS